VTSDADGNAMAVGAVNVGGAKGVNHAPLDEAPSSAVGAAGAAGGVIDTPLEGRPSSTRWSTVARTHSDRYGWLTLVDMWPKTGRTHQLRRHAAGTLGRPILGGGCRVPGGAPLVTAVAPLDSQLGVGSTTL
jgi:hypothetical protein